jgi:hypothetical protein
MKLEWDKFKCGLTAERGLKPTSRSAFLSKVFTWMASSLSNTTLAPPKEKEYLI